MEDTQEGVKLLQEFISKQSQEQNNRILPIFLNLLSKFQTQNSNFSHSIGGFNGVEKIIEDGDGVLRLNEYVRLQNDQLVNCLIDQMLKLLPKYNSGNSLESDNSNKLIGGRTKEMLGSDGIIFTQSNNHHEMNSLNVSNIDFQELEEIKTLSMNLSSKLDLHPQENNLKTNPIDLPKLFQDYSRNNFVEYLKFLKKSATEENLVKFEEEMKKHGNEDNFLIIVKDYIDSLPLDDCYDEPMKN